MHAVLVDNWLRTGNAVLYCRGIRGAVEFRSGCYLEASGRM
jgi:predicted methyltransferase MtxX (methanogen marker protein 4)